MKKYLASLFFLILTGCGASADSVITEKIPAGKITQVDKIQTSDRKQFGLSVSTSTGLNVFFQDLTPVQVGAEATLVTEKHKSGMIIRKLCYEAICAKLRGTTF